MWLLLYILGSFLVHLLILSLIQEKPRPRTDKPPTIPVRIEIKTKKNQEKDQEKAQIIEAPLPETQAPDVPAHLGAQNHRTEREQKTQGGGGVPGAPATALQNGPLVLERAPDLEGKVPVPKPPGKTYQDLLPQKLEVLNPGHNDYLPDKNLPVGPILDVNTTDFRFIAYFTAVRKSVDLAYFDIGPTLRETPHVRGRVEDIGRVRFQGSSVVQLKIARSGILVESKLVRSSGDKVVDEFWNKVLNLAAPYPPLPRDYPGEELVFTYTLYYDLVVEGDQRKHRFVF
jgi:hypothetical protein